MSKLKRESEAARIQPHQNGARRGPDTAYRLSSGRVLELRPTPAKFSELVWQAAGKPPQPPTQEIELAGVTETVEVPSDPDYLAELADYRARFNLVKMRLYLKWCVRYVLTEDEERDLDEMLADLSALGADENAYSWVSTARDRMVAYLELFELSAWDYEALPVKLVEVSTPNQEAVEAARAMFPSGVSGT
jgi:hypothetical protein